MRRMENKIIYKQKNKEVKEEKVEGHFKGAENLTLKSNKRL